LRIGKKEYLVRFIFNFEIIKNQVTFQAYDKDGDGYINSREFNEFIEESWLCAFRMLGEKLDGEKVGLTLSEINGWA